MSDLFKGYKITYYDVVFAGCRRMVLAGFLPDFSEGNHLNVALKQQQNQEYKAVYEKAEVRRMGIDSCVMTEAESSGCKGQAWDGEVGNAVNIGMMRQICLPPNLKSKRILEDGESSLSE